MVHPPPPTPEERDNVRRWFDSELDRLGVECNTLAVEIFHLLGRDVTTHTVPIMQVLSQARQFQPPRPQNIAKLSDCICEEVKD